MKTDDRELREVRLAVAGWFTGLPVGAGVCGYFTGANPYIAMFLLLSAVVLWETLRRAAWPARVRR